MHRILTRARPARPPADGQSGAAPWGRARLWAVLGAATGVVAVAGSGLVVLAASFLAAVTDHPTTPTTRSPAEAISTTQTTTQATTQAGPPGSEIERRDGIAAAPMLAVTAADALGGPPATEAAPMLTVPAARGLGPAGVASGFDHTPAGAVGQLAAIVTAGLGPISPARAVEVYQGWAMPGGTGPQAWAITGHVQAFRAHAGAAAVPGADLSIDVVPVAGQVKGVDGPDWVLGCVLVQATAVITTTARIAYGHCERLQWQSDGTIPGQAGRWVIAPGAAPAAAPSTWPGTQTALEAGWQTWMTTAPAGGPATRAGAGAGGVGVGG